MAVVLKSHNQTDEKPAAARSVTGLAGFNLDDLADQGRSRLEQCRIEIRKMLDEAEQEANALREQAQRDGYEAGIAKAEKDVQARVQNEAEQLASDSLETIDNAVKRLHQTHQEWMQHYADSLTEIAIAAAEKVCSRQLDQDRQILVKWAEDAVRSTRSATKLTLAVHPDTLAILGQAFDELLASPDLPEQTTVEPDESVEVDSVVVRQPGGEIQAGLRQQLQSLTELLS